MKPSSIPVITQLLSSDPGWVLASNERLTIAAEEKSSKEWQGARIFLCCLSMWCVYVQLLILLQQLRAGQLGDRLCLKFQFHIPARYAFPWTLFAPVFAASAALVAIIFNYFCWQPQADCRCSFWFVSTGKKNREQISIYLPANYGKHLAKINIVSTILKSNIFWQIKLEMEFQLRIDFVEFIREALELANKNYITNSTLRAVIFRLTESVFIFFFLCATACCNCSDVC